MSDSSFSSASINSDAEFSLFEVEQKARELRGEAIRYGTKSMRMWLRRVFSFPSANGRAPV
ncbi:RSP_7527 family protein [Aliiroseovarius sp. PTFE2010]|uniref:RSP_7527 family protein n=1 Tax=Aliiroseovarius sp. PTFE2010 TaxID=3417190 RepID=UPI003CF475D2